MSTERHFLNNIQAKNGEKFLVYAGIAPCEVDELISYANSDETVARHTSDRKRFADREAYAKWLKKERTIYTLSSDQNRDNLVGIIWFGDEMLPQPYNSLPELQPVVADTTFAIRTYDSARGRGLAVPFMRVCFGDFFDIKALVGAPKPRIWLETSNDNVPAIKSYCDFGFRQISKPDTHGKILMAL